MDEIGEAPQEADEPTVESLDPTVKSLDPAVDSFEPPVDSLDPPVDALIGLNIGNFTLDTVIGEGGMGRVYRAKHHYLARYKAVKVLGEEASRSSALVLRFENEALAACACQHDHIVQIEDSGTFPYGGRTHHYIEMEYLDGMDLGAACRMAPSNRIEDVDRAVKIIGYAADALAAAHARGIVHRDIKPENLFLANRGSRTDYVKVLDFGIARLTGELSPGTRTRTGQIMGTPEYMSPEQAAGWAVDAKSDVWSLATVLYRVLGGRRAFRADTFPLLAVEIQNHEPRPLGELRPDAPRGIVRAVERGMRKRAADRPAMSEWRDMLLAADAAPRAIQPELSIRSPNSLRHVSGPISSRARGTAPQGMPLPRTLVSTPRMVPLATTQGRSAIAVTEPAAPFVRPRRRTD